MKKTATIILGSGSPRRHELLCEIIKDFTVITADIDETPHADERPLEYSLRMAHGKAVKVAETVKAEDKVAAHIIIGADTIVELDGEIFGKPASREDAVEMLKKLSNKLHSVVTAFAILDTVNDKCLLRAVRSNVIMKELSEKDITEYVATGEADDKAGAYAIQGGAGKFIDKIEGSYSNIVGLPVEEVREALEEIAMQEASPKTNN